MSDEVAALSKTALARRYETMRASLRRVREETKNVGRIGTAGILSAAGGAAAGALASYENLRFVPGTTIPMDLVIGSALLTGAALDMFDGANDQVSAFAGGMLAFAAGREIQTIMIARAKAA
jgi:hypothetical protein